MKKQLTMLVPICLITRPEFASLGRRMNFNADLIAKEVYKDLVALKGHAHLIGETSRGMEA